MTEDRYDDGDRYGERLAALLAAAAETIEPAPDGLDRIRERVAARRRRRAWLRPVRGLGAVGAAAVAVLAVLAVLAVFAVVGRLRGGEQVIVEPAPAGVRVSADSPQEAARTFVRALGFPALDEVTGGDGQVRVDVGRTIPESGRRVTVTTVELARVGRPSDAWWVTAARAAGLRVDAPQPGGTIRSPLTVTGWLRGVDEAGFVEVRRYDSPRPLGQAPVSGGGGAAGQPWTLTVPFAGVRPGETLLVVARLGSQLDGEPSQLVVVPVQAG
jgi:hypothetical protein